MSKKDNGKPPKRERSAKERYKIRQWYADKAAEEKASQGAAQSTGVKPLGKRAVPAPRTATGKVPQGRTLKTYDNYLPDNKTGSKKERPVVVIESDEDNNLAVVPLSTQSGRNRTRLPNYQQGQSYFKHFVEIEDDEGNPIRVNDKFNENHPNMDVSRVDVATIFDTVMNHSVPMQANQKKMNIFRNKKNPRD